ncbi:MAG: hypothetical protein HOV66_23715 [Streptomycetaceae bacterium]|nr:hypothetical protein [Streptomycetaceae bacterium]
MEVLRLRGTRPAKITGVSLRGDDGLTLVGVRLVGPDRGLGAVQYSPSWPPAHDPDFGGARMLPADTVLTPAGAGGAGWELLLGLRADEPGRYERTAVVIDYTVGGRAYTSVRPAELVVCVQRQPVHGRPRCA